MAAQSIDTFHTASPLEVGGARYQIYRLESLAKATSLPVDRLPFSLKILLENLLRCEDDRHVSAGDIQALAGWDPAAKPDKEIAFMPARILLQDLTGVPAIVDLAAMREGIRRLGGDPGRINPLQPVDLVIDHSVQVDHFGSLQSFAANSKLEYERNRERYAFLRWGQKAFDNFSVVPPDTGIVHQINLEFLGKVVFTGSRTATPWPIPTRWWAPIPTRP